MLAMHTSSTQTSTPEEHSLSLSRRIEPGGGAGSSKQEMRRIYSPLGTGVGEVCWVLGETAAAGDVLPPLSALQPPWPALDLASLFALNLVSCGDREGRKGEGSPSDSPSPLPPFPSLPPVLLEAAALQAARLCKRHMAGKRESDSAPAHESRCNHWGATTVIWRGGDVSKQ